MFLRHHQTLTQLPHSSDRQINISFRRPKTHRTEAKDIRDYLRQIDMNVPSALAYPHNSSTVFIFCETTCLYAILTLDTNPTQLLHGWQPRKLGHQPGWLGNFKYE
eukprot:2026028-Karenia_brevis.AAC.1